MKSVISILFIFSLTTLHAQNITPTTKYSGDIEFTDDINFKNLDLAIERQLRMFRNVSVQTNVLYGSDRYTIAELVSGLEQFREIAKEHIACHATESENCLILLNQKIKQHFTLYRPKLESSDDGFASETPALFTSYYSPDLDGNLTQTTEYKYPVYSNPGAKLNGLYTRNEILLDIAFKNKAEPIFWVKNSMFDQYLFHIEGGGRVSFKDEEGIEHKRYLSYDGSNGKKLLFVYKYMLEQGYLQSGAASINQQRIFLEENPDKVREIFDQTPSFIYFKVTDDEPLGIQNIPLTEKRSIALDRNFYKMSGALAFIQGKLPRATTDGVVYSKEFSRFYLHQDTGGAIKGKARADLYAGFGEQAELEANYTKSNGNITFLLPKKK